MVTAAWVVELEPGVWLAPWDGDPGRTLVEASATRYPSYVAADRALTRAQACRTFLTPAIREVPS